MNSHMSIKYIIIFILSYTYMNSIGLWTGYKSMYAALFFVTLTIVMDLFMSELRDEFIFDS